MIRRILLFVAILVTGFAIAAPLTIADANNQLFGACNDNVSQSANNGSSVCSSKNTTQNPIVKNINVAANIIAAVAGVVAVIMAIISGLTFVSSGGSPEAIANAKKQLTYAIVGLVVIALAWAITRFVVDVIL